MDKQRTKWPKEKEQKDKHLQTTTQKTKDRATRISLKSGVFRKGKQFQLCPSGIRRATLGTNSVISHE
jgi:hypothetical protein